MPNAIGGKKFKRAKKGAQDSNNNEAIPLAEDNENCMYGEITKNIGTGFIIRLKPDLEVAAAIRGKMRKRVWCNVGDIVMVQQELNNYIVVHKYNSDEVRQLKSMGKCKFASEKNNDEQCAFKFEDDDPDNDPEFAEFFKSKKESDNKIVFKDPLEAYMPFDDSDEKSHDKSHDKPKSIKLNSKLDTATESETPEDETDDKPDDKPEDDARDVKQSTQLAKKFDGKKRGGKIIKDIKRAQARDKKNHIGFN
jgi:translation initiation factor 1A